MAFTYGFSAKFNEDFVISNIIYLKLKSYFALLELFKETWNQLIDWLKKSWKFAFQILVKLWSEQLNYFQKNILG